MFNVDVPIYKKMEENPSNIVSVEFEQGSICKVIREGAFKNCPKIKEITLPEGLREIHDLVFYKCIALKINFPTSIKSIKSSAFLDCHLYSPPKNLPLVD